MFVATKAIEYCFRASDVRVYILPLYSVAIPVLVACLHRLLLTSFLGLTIRCTSRQRYDQPLRASLHFVFCLV